MTAPMPDIPAEAVQAAAEAMGLAIVGKSLNDGTSSSPGFTLEQLAEFALRAAAPFLAGVGSPVSCPSAAPESTQSPETPAVAPVYPPAPVNPSGSLSAPRGEDAHPHASSHASEHAPGFEQQVYDRIHAAITDNYAGTPVNPSAVATIASGAALAVRDDELARLRREVAYVARTGEMWRQLWERVDRERSDALLRAEQAEGLALDGAGAVSEEQAGPLRHLGGNAEDCPACDITTLPYPFLCPGEEPTPPASTTEETP